MGNADTSLPRGKREKSIRNRLLQLLLIVLLPVLIMEGVVFYHRYETRLTEEFQYNLEIARAFGKTFESFYQNLIRAELIVGLALTADPSLNLQDQNRILDAFQADYPSIRSFFWIDKQGIIVASSLRSDIGFDISDRSFYREVIAGRDWHVSELIVGKVNVKPAFTISRGIRNQKGELLGIVAASIEPDSLDTALSLYRSSDAGVSLIDHRGMNVYRFPDFNFTWEQRNWLKQYPVMEDSLRGKEVTSRVTSDYSGKNRLVAFVPVSGIGWVASASQAEDDVVSDILSTLLFQSGLFLIISLAGFGSAVLFSRPLSKSITQLRDYAVALGRGGEQETIEAPAGPVEIREVYDEFNTMKEAVKRREAELRSEISERKQVEEALRESEEALRIANEHLEQRVRERTMDLQNLTEQLERSRHELRKLASELVISEERERKRVAAILHDEIAQTLAAARMRLDLLQSIPSDQKDKQTLQEVKNFLVQSIQETRALMNDIGNPLLFDLGLKSACESLGNRLMEGHPIRISCDIRDEYKQLDPDMKAMLFQVVRELLNNVVKHSQAKNAHVLIDAANGQFRVKVTDDGVGFDSMMLGVPSGEGGFGLYSMRERLTAMDGSLNIESTPGVGTAITAILPAALG